MIIVMIGKFNKIWDEEGKARSFEKLGHTVLRIEENDLDEEKLSVITKLHPDFVLFAKLKTTFAEQLIKACRANNIKTVCWHPDLYVGLPREPYIATRWHFKADYVFSPDGGNEQYFKNLGVNHRVIRQGVFDEDCKLGEPKAKYDIVFIGTDNPTWPYRLKLAGFLFQVYGKRFTWFGRGDSDEVRGQDLNDLIAGTKIVIGDSVQSDSYWSNRIYETIGRGGFIIHPMCTGLETEYKPYQHFIPYEYGDFAGLKEKIDYFLTQPSERDTIRLNGMKYTQQNLTLLNKCQELLDSI